LAAGQRSLADDRAAVEAAVLQPLPHLVAEPPVGAVEDERQLGVPAGQVAEGVEDGDDVLALLLGAHPQHVGLGDPPPLPPPAGGMAGPVEWTTSRWPAIDWGAGRRSAIQES